LRPTPEAYQEYGRLLAQLGDNDAAADAYRDGLNMVSATPTPARPLLSNKSVANGNAADETPKLTNDRR